MSDIGILDRLK